MSQDIDIKVGESFNTLINSVILIYVIRMFVPAFTIKLHGKMDAGSHLIWTHT